MLRIGLTGGIASGKTTAAQILHDLGAATFDADRIVAELYRPGAPGAKEVERLFGSDLIAPDGSVSKPALANLAFSDPAKRTALEAAIHPLVIERIRRAFAEARSAGANVAVAEASQLLEGGYEREFDRVLLVVAPLATRLARGQARGSSRADMDRRVAGQLAEEAARTKADDVIENGGTREDLRRRVEGLYRRWIAPNAPPATV